MSLCSKCRPPARVLYRHPSSLLAWLGVLGIMQTSDRRVHISLQEAEGVCFVLDVSEGCACERLKDI